MAPAKSQKRKSGQDQAVGEPSIKESSNETSLPMRAKEGDLSVPVKGTLKVFGDEDDAAAPRRMSSTSVAESTTHKEMKEEIENSDEDEAPEALSTMQAALDVKKSAQAAQKATMEQAAAQKRKRQQRDELFKQQAEERKKVKEATKAAAEAVTQSPDSGEAVTRLSETTSGRRRMDKRHIPAVLPADFLTDSLSEDEDEDEGSLSVNARPKRRKVSGVEKRLSRQDRGPRDEVVGFTVYRVAKKTDQRMAPKLKKYTKSSKDVLLRRNRSVVKSGFTRK